MFLLFYLSDITTSTQNNRELEVPSQHGAQSTECLTSKVYFTDNVNPNRWYWVTRQGPGGRVSNQIKWQGIKSWSQKRQYTAIIGCSISQIRFAIIIDHWYFPEWLNFPSDGSFQCEGRLIIFENNGGVRSCDSVRGERTRILSIMF